MGGHRHKRKQFAKHMRGRGPFGHDFGGGGRKRHRRGDIKFILLELIKEQPRHGYELIKVLEERYGGFYRPSPGTIYPTLQLLEDEGNLISETVDGKRVYKITSAGETLLEQHKQDIGDERFGFGMRGEPNWQDRSDLRHSAMALLETLMQAGRYGSPEQVKAIQELLTKANQDAHQILAGGSKSDTV
ncbi:MAG: PadR family transcriptional regulator [Anaerolineaceae bacterium]|nr:PadR family transcriptional regulator [Anaerolineaceae bacterium]